MSVKSSTKTTGLQADSASSELGECFTPAIQAFFRDAADWPWAEQFPRALFIRDYENLPERSPHDIDLLIDASHYREFLDHVAERCRAQGLTSVTWKRSDACFALIFDLDTGNEGRAWAFLEVREAIKVASSKAIRASDVDIVRDEQTGLPVPSRDWIAYLYIVQAMRKGQVAKMSKRLEARNIDPGAGADLLHYYTGVKPAFGETLAESVEALALLRKHPANDFTAKAKINPHPSIRIRLSQYLSRRYYFIPAGPRYFYSIHGPDGVGKSTACKEIERIFDRLPFSFDTFHHVTGWKYSGKEDGAQSSGGKASLPEINVGLIHRFLRTVYRRLPESVQQAYVTATSYNMYLRKLNELLDLKLRNGHIVLVDRYIYDLVIKNRMRGFGWGIIHRIFIRSARKPQLAFVLTDRAERIHSRKQELSMSEIGSYMESLDSSLQDNRIPTCKIDVEGLSPKQVAERVVEEILGNCSERLMPLLRQYREEGSNG